MFAKAYKIVREFTRPVIFSERFFDGTVSCYNGAFVILNREGWIITAKHIFDGFFTAQKHSVEIAEYQKQVLEINSSSSLTNHQKQQRKSNLHTNPKWITNHSFWWGNDAWKITQFKYLSDADVAIGQLQNFKPKEISRYPKIKNPKNLSFGTSLCKLGFPFSKISATFTEQTNSFTFLPGSEFPLFPLDGIYTRTIIAGKSIDGEFIIKFIETSSPGLRGQSGGPTFDIHGNVWAIQNRTNHIPLGFNPKIANENGKEVEEHQFINVGWGVHPDLIVEFLKKNNVKFEMSWY